MVYNNHHLFEYDPDKSEKNLLKHGIDFEQAQLLWIDPNLLEVKLHTEHEARFLAIGRIGLKHWSAIFTNRADKIRLISVRRSRKKEILYYENHN